MSRQIERHWMSCLSLLTCDFYCPGNGTHFSSGNDLNSLLRSLEDGASLQEFSKRARDVLENFVGAFIDFPKPIVGLVNGPAVGICVTTLGLYDYVLAVETVSPHSLSPNNSLFLFNSSPLWTLSAYGVCRQPHHLVPPSHPVFAFQATFHTPLVSLGLSPEGCSSFTFPQMMGPRKVSSPIAVVGCLQCHQANLPTASRFSSVTWISLFLVHPGLYDGPFSTTPPGMVQDSSGV